MAISQTAVFRRIVRDHMAPPPVQVREDARASELMLRLRERRASAAAVVDGRGGLVGIVTEQDLVRRLDEPGQQMATRLTSCCDEAECLNMADRLERLREHCVLQESVQDELVGASS